MKNLSLYVFVISLLFTLTGCDWIRSTLGMPTSDELQKMRQIMEEASAKASQSTPADTVDLTTSQAEPPTTKPASASYRFYVVVGSYKEASNAKKMETYLKNSGITPIRLRFCNGFNVVASSGHNDLESAYRSLRDLFEKSFTPEDIWIYDATKQKLHIDIN